MTGGLRTAYLLRGPVIRGIYAGGFELTLERTDRSTIAASPVVLEIPALGGLGLLPLAPALAAGGSWVLRR